MDCHRSTLFILHHNPIIKSFVIQCGLNTAGELFGDIVAIELKHEMTEKNLNYIGCRTFSDEIHIGTTDRDYQTFIDICTRRMSHDLKTPFLNRVLELLGEHKSRLDDVMEDCRHDMCSLLQSPPINTTF